MQFSLAILGAIALANAAYVPSEPWTTLKPSATYAGADVNHAHSFGIQIVAIASSTSPANAKRNVVNQIDDGQIQRQTATASLINQIDDGQIQRQTATASLINQIDDGQIQRQTATASLINQIDDGQIQRQTATASLINQIDDGQIQRQTATASLINQIDDGQIQRQTATASLINQIDDGQIQRQTATASLINQIDDGQIQQQTTTTTVTGVTQISDGQIQATSTAGRQDSTPGFPVACRTNVSLVMVLTNGELKDALGRIGAIVANRQFQFDGPPPQAGSIYAAGWSVTPDGFLALGDSDVFYQCKSGDFYNLYDENIAAQCEPVHLSVIDLVAC